MKKIDKYWIFGFALVLGLSACNLPIASPPDSLSLESQAGTLAAQTVEASLKQRATETQIPENTPTRLRPTKTSIPTETAIPTESPNLPAAPSLKNYDFFCSWNGSNNDLSITIKWTDKASDELGYLIYRNGEEIANLLPNVAQHADSFAVDTGQPVNYAIVAYNNNGESGEITISATCE